jgi:hypothetical protein
MSTFDDGGVRKPQQPERAPPSEGALANGCAGAILGGLCGAVSSVVTFVIVIYGGCVFFAGARANPSFGWALVGIGLVPIVGAGVGAIFGAAFLGAKGSFGWGVIGGCLGGVLTGAFPLVYLFG